MAQHRIRNPKTVIRQFVNSVVPVYPIDLVVLYGSYARGWQREWSDLDLAIVSQAFDRQQARAWDAVRRMAYAISPQLDVRPFGRHEFAHYERGDFIHEIHRTGKPIFQWGRWRWPSSFARTIGRV